MQKVYLPGWPGWPGWPRVAQGGPVDLSRIAAAQIPKYQADGPAHGGAGPAPYAEDVIAVVES